MTGSWRVLAVASVSLAAIPGCSGESSSDGGEPARAGASNGGSTAQGGSSGAGKSSGGTGGQGGMTTGGSSGLGGSSGTTTTTASCDVFTGADARRLVVANLRGTLHEAVSGLGFVEGSQLIGRLLKLGAAPGNLRFVDDASERIDDWVNELETRVLADGNVEEENQWAVSYRMTSAVYCAPDPDDVVADPAWAAEMQADCADDLALHPIRVSVERITCREDGSLYIGVEIGEPRIKPITFGVGPQRFSVGVDVAETLRYLREEGDQTEFDADSGGSVVIDLDTSSAVTALEIMVKTPILLGATDDGEHSRVAVAGMDLWLKANADEQVASASIATSGISVDGSFRTLIEGVFGGQVAANVPPSYGVTLDLPGVTDVAVEGVTGSCEYQSERLSCTDLGFGDSPTVLRSEDGTLLTADLNAAANRSLDVELSLAPDGSVRVAPTPGATLELGFHLGVVQDKLESIQQFALDDVVRFGLTGDAPSALLLLNDDGDLALTSRTEGAEVLVEAGTFEMSSEWSGPNVSVEAGQCLSYSSASAVAHEILRGYNGLSCVP